MSRARIITRQPLLDGSHGFRTRSSISPDVGGGVGCYLANIGNTPAASAVRSGHAGATCRLTCRCPYRLTATGAAPASRQSCPGFLSKESCHSCRRPKHKASRRLLPRSLGIELRRADWSQSLELCAHRVQKKGTVGSVDCSMIAGQG